MSNNEEVVDSLIKKCLEPANYHSFFLFAGAGSGKTRTLVSALQGFKKTNLSDLVKHGKRVSVITYTNAACNEIKERVNFDESFEITTIHSFSWSLIQPFTEDIRSWIESSSEKELIEIEEKDRKGNPNSKAALERATKKRLIADRIKNIKHVRKFRYSPSGVNEGWDSLQHAEVIKIASEFILNKQLLQDILIGRSPVILIDESQDTQKGLISALLTLEEKKKGEMCLGLLGDLMQRIYLEGKPDLGANLPSHWSRPEKTTNYRCPKRVVKLINSIRIDADNHQQVPARLDDGFVRLFLANVNSGNSRSDIELKAAQRMAQVTGDEAWLDTQHKVKTLTLEHHMAASRGGFEGFFIPLYQNTSTKSGVLDGSLEGLSFLTDVLVPLIAAIEADNEFVMTRIIKGHSNLLTPDVLEDGSPIEKLRKTNALVGDLKKLLESDPSLAELLNYLFKTKLLAIPRVFIPLIEVSEQEFEDSDDDKREGLYLAWESALSASPEELKAYVEYLNDQSGFDTHQGVKGREFDRVMAVLDDKQARGNSFSYEKLLGAKDPSKTDIENEGQGKETSIDRTRRLFYVACSRAMESLAIVVYTEDPEAIRQHSVGKGWFFEPEIELLT